RGRSPAPTVRPLGPGPRRQRAPGDGDTPFQRTALRLDPGGDVHGVAAVDDVLLDVADLRRDHGAAVETGLEFGHDAVAGQVSILLLVDALAHEKHAA